MRILLFHELTLVVTKGEIWVRLNSGDEQRVSEFDSVVLGDNQIHKIQISTQNNVIEISEPDSGEIPQRVVIDNDKLILDSGIIRLGLKIPRQTKRQQLNSIICSFTTNAPNIAVAQPNIHIK